MRLLMPILGALLALTSCATDRKGEQQERERRMARRIQEEQRADDDAAAAVPAPVLAKPVDRERSITLHLLDVGQGAATLIEFPCGAMLVDTGGEQNESFDGVASLIKQLEAFFARRTDLNRTLGLLVITHPHVDHVKGIPALLAAFKVQNVVDNGLPGDDLVKEEIGALRRHTEQEGVGYRGLKTADIVKKNGFTDDVVDPFSCSQVDPIVRLLSGSWETDPGWGTDNYGHLLFDNMNNHSVVVRVDAGNASILITGDLEKVAIAGLIKRYRDTRWLDVDVYSAGHHGSANGTTRELMAVMTPSVALISAGSATREHSWTAWAYGHPRGVIVDMLEAGVTQARPVVEVPVGKGMKRFANRSLGSAIFSTAWDGAVVVDMTIDGAVTVRPRAK
ncbi:MAG: MBL fold metallo-hydrolase [Deltaproteobacteria bacterium]|nr:MBL fold metallo-hydrolase [Deltaproteobacteria bacterium]